MARLPFRAQQFVISLIGALLLIPMDLHLGGRFTFSFNAHSASAWLFGLTAFWCQILAILISFFKPRLGGAWILVNIALSIAIQVWVAIRLGAGAGSLPVGAWGAIGPAYAKAVFLFWITPLILALLLLRPTPRKERVAQNLPAPTAQA